MATAKRCPNCQNALQGTGAQATCGACGWTQAAHPQDKPYDWDEATGTVIFPETTGKLLLTREEQDALRVEKARAAAAGDQVATTETLEEFLVRMATHEATSEADDVAGRAPPREKVDAAIKAHRAALLAPPAPAAPAAPSS